MAAGAVGARLTGAGWGGCVVAAMDIREVTLDAFTERVHQEYFQRYLGRSLDQDELQNCIFAFVPGGPARVLSSFSSQSPSFSQQSVYEG